MTIILLTMLVLANNTVDIIEKILPNEEERIALTVDYLKIHKTDPLSELNLKGEMVPQVIVVHWTANNSSEATMQLFSSATLRGRKGLQPYGSVNVSSHYVVDKDGTIYQILPDNRIARHCIGLNHISIGIENVGGVQGEELSAKQLEANIQLIAHLSNKHRITHLIGHYEYQKMEGHPYFEEQFDEYRTIKIDPGISFMKSLREDPRILQLNLSQPTIEVPPSSEQK